MLIIKTSSSKEKLKKTFKIHPRIPPSKNTQALVCAHKDTWGTGSRNTIVSFTWFRIPEKIGQKSSGSRTQSNDRNCSQQVAVPPALTGPPKYYPFFIGICLESSVTCIATLVYIFVPTPARLFLLASSRVLRGSP